MSEQKAPSEALRAAQTAAPDDQSDEGHKPDTSGDRLAFVSRILPRRISRRVLFDIALLVTSILVFGAIAVALGEDVNWDLLNYHYYDGYAALQGGRQDFVPAMLQTYFVPTLDILQYLLIAHLPPVAVGFILGGFQGINFWLVFQIASSLIHLSRAWLEWPLWFACAALGMYAPTSRAELGVTRGDLTLSVLVLAGLLLLLRISTREITGRAPVLLAYIAAGALLGFAAGSKYTLAPYALMAVVAFVAVPQVDGLRGRQERQRLKTLLSSGLHWLKTLAIVGSSALVGLFAGGGWWMLLL